MNWLFIRGARILKQLFEVSTEPDLEQNIERGFPDTKKRQHATGEVTVNKIEYIPYVGTHMLHVRSFTSSTSGNRYQQAMQFLNVQFENEDTDTNATFVATDGKDYHIEPLDLTNHNVKVRCNCMDFHWRFASYNSQDKSLIGRPPPLYIKKTDRPPVNPMGVPGMCKHLLKVVETLQRYNLVKPG